jgi:hypothetical protein
MGTLPVDRGQGLPENLQTRSCCKESPPGVCRRGLFLGDDASRALHCGSGEPDFNNMLPLERDPA